MLQVLMTTINIYVDSLYACHIAYFTFLLKLDSVNIISPNSNLNFDFHTSGYEDYYRHMLDVQYEQTKYYIQDSCLFEWFIKNMFTFHDAPPTTGIDLTIQNSSSIQDAEADLLNQLDALNIFPSLNHYTDGFTNYISVISGLINALYERPATQEEIDYYYEANGFGNYSFNDIRFVDVFAFLHVLHFSSTGRSLGLHLPWLNAFKPLKFSLPITTPTMAVVLSGHTRNYSDFLTSHHEFIDNPYIDIFIHTWIHKGPRYEYVNAPTDTSALTQAYRPTSILVEDERPLKDTFSLRGRLNPIFLIQGQQGDDASHYENSKMYSMWKALTLVEAYEQQNNVS